MAQSQNDQSRSDLEKSLSSSQQYFKSTLTKFFDVYQGVMLGFFIKDIVTY